MRFVIVMFSKSKLCAGVLSILRNSQTPVAWRLREEAGHIHRLLSCPHIPDPELIGRGKNAIADRITLHARHNPNRSLFAKGCSFLSGSTKFAISWASLSSSFYFSF